MVRNIEKLIKIECPRDITKRNVESVETFSIIPKLNLMDLESCIEPGTEVHVDLGLDQLEQEE
ncbi:hypothetical protein KJN74_02845 [Candidatus Bathyarchaeota archaeon]|nr:hypothetical protein [Candidatus Bathyarchaeota archaeon]